MTPTPAFRTCLWYRRGLLAEEPLTAIVNNVNTGGILDLTVFPRGDSRPQSVPTVRHRDDPQLEQFPRLKQEYGCWDYLPHDPAATPPPAR